MNPWIAFAIGAIVGSFVGATIGIFAAALCVAADKQYDIPVNQQN